MIQRHKDLMEAPGDRHENNFDLFRIMAATFVIFYHSFALSGTDGFGIYGLLGVSIFFVISGYFITQSWTMRPSAVHFLWNRFLRLVPALGLVVVFTIFIIGPLSTELSLMAYFTDYRTWMYFLNIPLLYGAFNLPGVFLDNFIPKAVNGSLWTIHLEVRMYAVIMVLGLTGLLKNKKIVAGTTLIAAALYVVGFLLVPTQVVRDIVGIPFLLMPQPTGGLYPPLYALLFMAGALLYLYKDVVAYHPIALVCIAILWLYSISTQYLLMATLLCLPYLVISFGFMKIPLIGRLTRHGDFSYGLYIFAFPVQQAIIHFSPTMGPWFLFGISFPLTLLLAILSWKLVESKALILKKQDPRLLWKKITTPRPIVTYKQP